MRASRGVRIICLSLLATFFGATAGVTQTVNPKLPEAYPKGLNMGSAFEQQGVPSTPDKEQMKRSNVKSMTVWQYDAASGKVPGEVVEGSGLKILSASYDEEGNEVEQTAFSPGGKVTQKISVDYDTSGFISESVINSYIESVDQTINQRVVYEYDPDNRLVKVSSYDLDGGEVSLQIDYSYDGAGHVVGSSTFMPNGLANMRSEYTYDTDERIAMVVFIDQSEGRVMIQSEFNYDADGWETVSYGPDDEVIEKTRNNYDSSGNIARVIRYDSQHRVISDVSYTYDSEGRVLETVSALPSADMKTRTTSTYDDQGNVVEQVTYNKLDEPVKVLKYEYEYFE